MTRSGTRSLVVFAFGLLPGLSVAGAVRAGPTCPCGFKADALSGGCQVVLGPVNCGTPGSGGGSPPSGSSGSPGSTHTGQSGYAGTPGSKPCTFPPCDAKKCPKDTAYEMTVAVAKAQGKLPPPPEMANCPNSVAVSADMAIAFAKKSAGCEINRADYSEIFCKTLKSYTKCMKEFPYSPLCGRSGDKRFYTAPCCKLNGKI